MFEAEVRAILDETVYKDLRALVKKHAAEIDLEDNVKKAVNAYLKSDNINDIVYDVLTEDCGNVLYKPIMAIVKKQLTAAVKGLK